MTLIHWIVIALTLLGPLQVEQASNPPKDVIEVITLTHTDAERVAFALKELGANVASTAVAQNRLVLRGRSEDVQSAIKDIIAKVDVPEVGGGPATIDYIELRQVPPPSFETLIEAVAPREFGTHYALDRASRLIAVNAPREKISSIRKLVEVMDRPTQSYLIHFYVLKGIIDGGAPEPADESLPKDVAVVAKALHSAGFGDLALVAPLIVQGVDGASFQSSVAQPRDGREEGDSLGIQVRGKPFAEGSGAVVQLELEVHVTGRTVQPKESGSVVTYPILLSAESTITVKLDSCVVLAAAPTASSNGEAYAVVVKVTRAAAGKP